MKPCFTVLVLFMRVGLALPPVNPLLLELQQQFLKVGEHSRAIGHAAVATCDFSQTLIKGSGDLNLLVNSPQWIKCLDTATKRNFKFPRLMLFFNSARSEISKGSGRSSRNVNEHFDELEDYRPNALPLNQTDAGFDRLQKIQNLTASALDGDKIKAYLLTPENATEITAAAESYFVHAKAVLSGCKMSGELDLNCFVPLKNSIFQDLDNFTPGKYSRDVSIAIAKVIRDFWVYVRPMEVEATKRCIADKEKFSQTLGPLDKDEESEDKTKESETPEMAKDKCTYFSPGNFIRKVDELFLSTQILRVESRNFIHPKYILDARIIVQYARLATLEATLMTEMANYVNEEIILEMFYDIIIMLRDSKKAARGSSGSSEPSRPMWGGGHGRVSFSNDVYE